MANIVKVFGVISLIIFLIAGVQMMGIESKAGNTVAETYYNLMGLFSIGMAFLSGGILWGIGCIIENNSNNTKDDTTEQELPSL